MLGLVALLLPLLMASSEGFLMTRVDPGVVTVKPGDSFSLLCVVSATILHVEEWQPKSIQALINSLPRWTQPMSIASG